MTSLLNRIYWTGVGILVAFILGCFVGYQEKAFRVKAEQTEKLQEVRASDSAAIVSAVETDKKVEKAKVEIRYQTRTVIKEIEKYVPATQTHSEDLAACEPAVLNVAAVSLLNAARTGTPVDPSEWSNETSRAPTAIGLRELSESDAEIAGLYRELAESHNALVDFVEKKLAEQVVRNK